MSAAVTGGTIAVRALVLAQALAIAAFLVALIATLVFPDRIREAFRAAINDDVAQKLERRVTTAEELLATPLAKKILAPHHLEVAREEIALYRRDRRATYRRSRVGKSSTRAGAWTRRIR